MRTRQHYRQYPEERFKPWQFTDFYHVETMLGTFVVSMATARHIDRFLATHGDLEWIELHDLSGVQHRVQKRHVSRITAHR